MASVHHHTLYLKTYSYREFFFLSISFMIIFMSMSMSGFKSQSYGEILGTFCFGILRGSVFVAQAGLELVILLIAGIIGVSPYPEKICVLKSHSCSIVIWMSSCLETHSESEHAMSLCLVSHLDCFQFQSVVRPAAQP